MRVGTVPSEMDRASLSLDVADFIAFYSGQPLEHFDVSGALTEMTEIMWRYGIMLPARLAMLIKVLVTLEGTARLLSPKFSLMQVMTPYRKEILKRRLSPRRQWRRIRRLISETQHLVEILPRGLIDILQQVQTGQFDVHLDHRGLEPSVNRLVLGMLTSAIFVGSSLLLSRSVPPLVYDISVPGMAGIILSMGMALRVWLAINKSGHLDRRK
jgi:ubiquinone biosynthesis protein